MVGRAKGAADTPVDAAGAGPVGSVGFDRRAGCVDTVGPGDNLLHRNCYHWGKGPSKATAGTKHS